MFSRKERENEYGVGAVKHHWEEVLYIVFQALLDQSPCEKKMSNHMFTITNVAIS